MRVLVLIAAAGAALLAIAIALLLTRRALRPLADLSAAARAIGETGDATRRLPPTGVQRRGRRALGDAQRHARSLERAREAERRFVADASHELRTPLTALRGNAAYIAQHGANAEVLADLEADADAPRSPARRPACTGARGRRRPGPDRAVRLDRLALEPRPATRSTVDAPAAGHRARRRARARAGASPTWSRTRSCTARPASR